MSHTMNSYDWAIRPSHTTNLSYDWAIRPSHTTNLSYDWAIRPSHTTNLSYDWAIRPSHTTNLSYDRAIRPSHTTNLSYDRAIELSESACSQSSWSCSSERASGATVKERDSSRSESVTAAGPSRRTSAQNRSAGQRCLQHGPQVTPTPTGSRVLRYGNGSRVHHFLQKIYIKTSLIVKRKIRSSAI